MFDSSLASVLEKAVDPPDELLLPFDFFLSIEEAAIDSFGALPDFPNLDFPRLIVTPLDGLGDVLKSADPYECMDKTDRGY